MEIDKEILLGIRPVLVRQNDERKRLCAVPFTEAQQGLTINLVASYVIIMMAFAINKLL